MNRRQLLAVAVSATAAGLVRPVGWRLTALADPPSDTLATVTKVDGKTVKGKITSYDRDKITLDVTAKSKDAPVSTDIPWAEVRKVSTGLTRDMGVQKWKADHKGSLCDTCFGNGDVFCPKCHGTAHDPAANANCPTCKGAEQVACKTPRCDHGTIPCTNPKCLKLSDPGWYKKPDGSRWKKFPEKGGTAEWSEHHLGSVIDKVNGHWAEVGTCTTCGGVTTITDPACRGTSKIPCPACSKNDVAAPCPDHCKAGLVQCPTCAGTGLKA